MSRSTCMLMALVAAVCGCELTEVVVAVPEDIVVAEVIVRAGEPRQTAYLHRTSSARGSARVRDAVVVITDEARGSTVRLDAAADSLCMEPARPAATSGTGSCYAAETASDVIRPGARYTLRIELPDGRVLAAATVVPGAFGITSPQHVSCELVGGTHELVWTQSAGAWVYLAETRLHGVRQALRAAGVAVPAGDRPVELLGLSIGGADTTMLFPGQFGLFDRFDDSLYPVLVALQQGVPPGVHGEVVIAAADRNYVNWVRGGNFNPSGIVRIPSVSGGGGTGVFGSMVPRRVEFFSSSEADVSACR